ncbi:MAG: hypothetical protein LBV60_10485, partial [Streptomyces sp.]|nr:hypothetical protein [Streptomyces sp.]
ELLYAGVSNHNIARETGTSHRRVAAIRASLDLPDARTIKGPATAEDLFWRRTKPAGDHLEWDGDRNSTGVPVLHTTGRMYTARRIAFRIRYGREPIGRVTAGCDQPDCVHPRFVEDQPMRDQYTATFGDQAA